VRSKGFLVKERMKQGSFLKLNNDTVNLSSPYALQQVVEVGVEEAEADTHSLARQLLPFG